MLIDAGLELLSEDECQSLLDTESVGRVGLSVGALPAIFPVNYRLVGGAILFRTGEGRKLRAAMHHTVVAFEVDYSDAQGREGWSVLVVGMAEVITQTEVATDLVLPSSWAGGDRSYVVRIRPEFVSGRRIVSG